MELIFVNIVNKILQFSIRTGIDPTFVKFYNIIDNILYFPTLFCHILCEI